MEDDSTGAEWGTPHTTSFSTIDSQQQSTTPPLPPPEAGPSGYGQPQQPGQQYHHPGPEMDFILFAHDSEEQYADGLATQEQIPCQHSQPQQSSQAPFSSYPTAAQAHLQSNGHEPSHFDHNGNDMPSSPPQPLQLTENQPPSEAASIQQWRGPPPWSPVLGPAENADPIASMRTAHPPDRNYRDKIEEELEELGRAADIGPDGDEGKNKKGRTRKGKKRRGHPSGSRGSERDKRGRGGGSNGYGIRAS